MENVMFCSLAVGESYLRNFINFCNEKRKKDNSKNLAVTDKGTYELLTDLINENSHIEYVVIDDKHVISEWPLGFNFNLKCATGAPVNGVQDKSNTADQASINLQSLSRTSGT
jgi:hypothetical protein